MRYSRGTDSSGKPFPAGPGYDCFRHAGWARLGFSLPGDVARDQYHSIQIDRCRDSRRVDCIQERTGAGAGASEECGMIDKIERYLLVIVSAPSGAGKTTLCNRLLSKHADMSYSVSCTTRLPREGEVEGEDYH